MATLTLPYVFVPGALAKASEVNSNFDAVKDFLEDSIVHRDASRAFTGIPMLPASDPTSDNHAARKGYVDPAIGVATFSGETETSLSPSWPVKEINGFSQLFARGVTVSNDGITLTKPGIYIIGFSMTFTSSSSGSFRQIRAHIDGWIQAPGAVLNPTQGLPGGMGHPMSCIGIFKANGGEKVRGQYRQDSGNLLDANAALWVLRVQGT